MTRAIIFCCLMLSVGMAHGQGISAKPRQTDECQQGWQEILIYSPGEQNPHFECLWPPQVDQARIDHIEALLCGFLQHPALHPGDLAPNCPNDPKP